MYGLAGMLAESCCRPAPVTMLTANEHHPETRSTRDGREARAAKLTLRGIAGTSGAAVRTVKCFCLHGRLFYQFAY